MKPRPPVTRMKLPLEVERGTLLTAKPRSGSEPGVVRGEEFDDERDEVDDERLLRYPDILTGLPASILQ
jgi:hypothetical protein